MSSRFVSILAPYLTLYLPDLTFDQMPFIVFGIGTLLGSVASCFLPESLGHPLPGTRNSVLPTRSDLWNYKNWVRKIYISNVPLFCWWESWKHCRFHKKSWNFAIFFDPRHNRGCWQNGHQIILELVVKFKIATRNY